MLSQIICVFATFCDKYNVMTSIEDHILTEVGNLFLSHILEIRIHLDMVISR